MLLRRFPFTPLVAFLIAALACSPLAAPRRTATPAPTDTAAAPADTAAPRATHRPAATAAGTEAVTGADTPAPEATSSEAAATEVSSPVPLKIVSILPMNGLSVGQVMANAEQLRLDQANGQACGGQYALSLEAWDDAAGKHGTWDPALETADATRAAADPAVVAVLGPYFSGAAKLAIPILNQSGPLVIISPENSYPGLTKPGEGANGEPDIYYPTGVRNYARVMIADDVQGATAARFVHDSLSAQTVYILDDHEPYGQLAADVFEATAKDLGLTVVGRTSVDPTTANLTTLMKKIAASNHGQPPDAIYAGLMADNTTGSLLKAKVAAMGDNTQVKLIGTEGLEDPAIIDAAGANVADGLYTTITGLPIDQLPAAGQAFYADYAKAYGHTDSLVAVYAYEAMSAALKAIEEVCAAGGDPTDRQAVRDAVFNLQNFDGALGTWSFDANGDTSLTDMTFDQVVGGKFTPVAVSVAGQITAIQ